MESLACNICKEPAWNFMCMNCVAKDVDKFLPRKLSPQFQQFHRNFYTHFDSPQLILNGQVYCVNCKSTQESPICQHCYTREVHTWLEERNLSVARQFLKMFSFGGLEEHTAADNPSSEVEFGICDECGEYADELENVDGEWMCTECAVDQEE